MTTHIFVVDYTTFKVHLENLFIGTGARKGASDFNDSNLHHSTERNLVGMVADANRIRKENKVIFYLQQNAGAGIGEGKFYGIFKAVHDWSFLDNDDGNQYLKSLLIKSLNFRALIKPYKIYPQGVTEWEALDEIREIQSPHQMLWSLIYRKLKGRRGNTMITIYESERLCHLIKSKNQFEQLPINGKKISYDLVQQKIISTEEPIPHYMGRKDNIDVLPKLINKYNKYQAFETHLQAYIIKNIGKGINKSLDICLLDEPGKIEWIGNEVYCGVGMQRIDIMISIKEDDEKIVVPIELKHGHISSHITGQMQRYVNWIKQYYLPNRIGYIKPTLICKKADNKNDLAYREALSKFNNFNHKNSNNCRVLKYIEFSLVNDDLFFEVVNY